MKPDSPLEEEPQLNEAEAAMEERREAKKPEESRLSAGGAHNTKEETQSAQQTSRQASLRYVGIWNSTGMGKFILKSN